ncbi:MAG TPA: 2-oxoacid:ferredoxin oxidoreductase subunit beta [candidate division WOR-3 bacterium]|uniref:2-oxoacid:ferredoxin oxidoreductase subunit beta n=1 Tax=candidate division WOR-3 bacterium TaxID=2052148 RepID=A0A9C9EL50_UNCW3|nr:2-oxoacid:ferredoxin oxidoreductase subunit beta [candidate division WOR-3 bacterium]
MNSIISIFNKAIEKSGIERKKLSMPSDIPFKPETVKELGVDYFQTTRGRAIAFGTGLKLANPRLKVMSVVGDLMTLGGNHFVHAGRRNMELLVICVNNFIYKRINNKSVPFAKSVFSPYSTFEEPFNFPHLGNSCGAVYTARWTALHTEELIESIAEALNKKGLAMVEILAPGPNYYRGIEDIEHEILKFYYDNSVVKNGENPRNAAIIPEEKIVVGKFTDKERPTFIDSYNSQLSKILGDKFVPHGTLPLQEI